MQARGLHHKKKRHTDRTMPEDSAVTPIRTTRCGATLIELLVVMAIAAALGAMALALLPGIANSDNALKGAAEVQGTCKIAQAYAASSRQPRGVRLLVLPGGTISTEMQFLEAPPVMVADPLVLVAKKGDTSNGVNTAFGPRVKFTYTLNGASAVTKRQCFITGLTADQENQVTDGAILSLPTLGAWSRIKGPFIPPSGSPTPLPPRTIEVILDVYPDAALGAATEYLTYHFGIYGVPVPMIAEPTILMPKNTAIDLAVSLPPQLPIDAGKNYDILFAPSGQTITTYGTASNTGLTANTGVFLWVRDPSKVTNPNGANTNSMVQADFPGYPTTPGLPHPEYANGFRRGGEQQIVGIRNGFIGSAAVQWPDNSGVYQSLGPTAPLQNPFTLIRTKMN